MKILSIRRGFQADHSSTSYEFFAIDKPLEAADRKTVSKLSSRARPSKRRVSFIYNGEWSDLPGGWEPLVKKYYDVMYSESYDWWTLAMAFNANQASIQKIKKYRFRGSNDMGVDANSKKGRLIVTIFCRINADVMGANKYPRYDDYGEKKDDGDTDALDANDNLLNLLAENRRYLQKGDCRLLYGVWGKCGGNSEEAEEKDEKTPPKPSGMNQLPKPIKRLLSLLDQDE